MHMHVTDTFLYSCKNISKLRILKRNKVKLLKGEEKYDMKHAKFSLLTEENLQRAFMLTQVHYGNQHHNHAIFHFVRLSYSLIHVGKVSFQWWSRTQLRNRSLSRVSLNTFSPSHAQMDTLLLPSSRWLLPSGLDRAGQPWTKSKINPLN